MSETQPSVPILAIIEDNTELSEETARFLQSMGYEVWTAGSAEDFYRQLHSKAADILLVDLGLPGEDGLDLIHYIRNHYSCGIIATTARGSRDDRVTGFGHGVDYYLVKPVDPTELIAIIDVLWKRLAPQQKPKSGNDLWWLDPTLHHLNGPSGKTLELTSSEYLLVERLLDEPNQTINKENLHRALFPNENDVDLHRIDVVLNRIRSKAKKQNVHLPIRSVFGRGLAFVTAT